MHMPKPNIVLFVCLFFPLRCVNPKKRKGKARNNHTKWACPFLSLLTSIVLNNLCSFCPSTISTHHSPPTTLSVSMASSAVIGWRILFLLLGCTLVTALVYTVATDGSPFRQQILSPYSLFFTLFLIISANKIFRTYMFKQICRLSLC